MKIKVSNSKYTGKHANYDFKDGVAEVAEGGEEKAIKVARDLGYEIIEDKPKKAPAKKSTKKSEVVDEVSVEETAE